LLIRRCVKRLVGFRAGGERKAISIVINSHGAPETYLQGGFRSSGALQSALLCGWKVSLTEDLLFPLFRSEKLIRKL
jgi:hypothetical protein